MNAFEIIATAVSAAGGSAAVIAGLAAWLGKVWLDRISQNQKLLAEQAAQLRKNLADIDVDLRNKRIPKYEHLWKLTGICPFWPRKPEATYEDLRAFSDQLRIWYYEDGGMYLSESARKKSYGPLQEAVTKILTSNRSGRLRDEDYDVVRDRCSALRTALTKDLESRREGLEDQPQSTSSASDQRTT